ncbi:MAG: hemolysin III family protein [Armatimonadetes bacterium]|nr:hemolysin III family protein [Armatimonadota bacterium]
MAPHGKADSAHEELANSVTHGVGAVLSVAGLVVLVALACLKGTAWHIVGCSVYGGTLAAMYVVSTLYHSFRTPRLKHVFKTLDHCCIYLLIAGSFTPFALVNLRGGWGWSLFGVLWGFALVGVLFKIYFVGKFETVSTVLYLLMGWLVLIAAKPMLATIPAGGIGWLVAGGLAYSAGVIFYAWKKLPYNHAIWHLFVLAGSVCHYFAIYYSVLPWNPKR